MTSKRGKPLTIYLHATDLEKLRDIRAALAGRGGRSTSSMIVRAALYAASPGALFMEAYRQVADADRRFKRERARAEGRIRKERSREKERSRKRAVMNSLNRPLFGQSS